MNWTIQRAGSADARRLTELARAAKAHWGYPPAWLAAWEADLTLTPAYVTAHRVFAAREADSLIGVCALEDRESHWALEHVWVDPAHLRRGVGAALVRSALVEARAIRPAVVVVLADPHAAGFYARLGAHRVGATSAPMPGAPERELPRFEFVESVVGRDAADDGDAGDGTATSTST